MQWPGTDRLLDGMLEALRLRRPATDS